MTDDLLSDDEALEEIVDAIFTEHGPQINTDVKDLMDRLFASAKVGMDPEEEEIAAVGLTVGMVNGVMVMSLERWGLEVTIKILQEILSRYKGYMHKLDGLN